MRLSDRILPCLVISLLAAMTFGCGENFMPPTHPEPTADSFELQATTGWVRSIWGDPSGQIFALIGEHLLHYDGAAWRRLDAFRFHDDLRDLWGSSATDVFAVGYGGVILHYDGTAWTAMTRVTNATLHAVWGTGPDDVFAVGENFTILHYDGVQWTAMEPPWDRWPQSFSDVWGRSGSDVFVTGSSVLLHYDGVRWSTLREGGWSTLWGSGEHVFVGRAGVVLHHDGIAWEEMPTGTNHQMRAAWGSSPSDVYFVGDESVLHWDGLSWTENRQSGRALWSIWGRGAHDVFVAGSQFLHYDGSRWDSVLGLIAPLREVCVLSDHEFLAFGRDGEEVFYHDGAGWNSLGAFHGYIRAAWGSGASDVFVVGTHDNDGGEEEDGYADGYIYHYDGAGWSRSGWSPRGLNAVWGSSGTAVFVVGDGGIILRYDGLAWREMPSGTTESLAAVWGSAGNDVFAANQVNSEIEILHYDGMAWSVMSRHAALWSSSGVRIWGSSSRDVYVASKENLLHYDGSVWSPVSLGSTSVGWDVWGRSGSDVYAFGGSGVLHYDGATWRPLDLGQRGAGPAGVFDFAQSLTRLWGNAEAIFLANSWAVYRLGPASPAVASFQ